MRRWLGLGAAALAACGLSGSPTMAPGRNCLECHDGGRARQWTAAGTVFPSFDAPREAGVLGAHVVLTDAGGRTLSLQSNVAGNFYTAESLAFPLQACIAYGGATICMTAPVERGGCNACHASPPENGAPGRLAVP